MFVVNLKYIVPLSDVLSVRPDHVIFLEKYHTQKKFIFSGRKYTQDGGIIIVNSKDEDEVHKIMKHDPFIINKVATYEIIGFEPMKNPI